MPSDSATKSYLAFDIGAESGRAVLARLSSRTLEMEEVHRFANKPVQQSGSLHWDVAQLWREIRTALAKLGERRLEGIGVDTWGVDYALLSERGELLETPYHYRDSRTQGVMEAVFKIVPKEEIYSITGIQFLPFNTLYQLFATKLTNPRVLDAVWRMVTIPDLLNYWLTGKAVCEFTNATTTQFVNPKARTWAGSLIEQLGLPGHLLVEIVESCTLIGPLQKHLTKNTSL